MNTINDHINKIFNKIQTTKPSSSKGVSGCSLILNNSKFMRYLARNYPAVYEFVYNCFYGGQEDCEKYEIATAAVMISKNTGRPVLLVNYYLAEYFLDSKNFSSPEEGYDFLSKILLHEMLHIVLNHFRRKFPEKESEKEQKLRNIAFDIVVDNLIYYFYTSSGEEKKWRNWSDTVPLIKNLAGKHMSNRPSDDTFVLNYSDFYILQRILELPQEIQERLINEQQKCDQHVWDEKYDGTLYSPYTQQEVLEKTSKRSETETVDSELYEEKSSDSLEESDSLSDKLSEEQSDKESITEEIVKSTLTKVHQRSSLPSFSSIPCEKMLLRIYETKYYNWKNRLRRYIPLISSQVVTYTWKKPNRRLPGKVPGVKRQLRPGSVLIVFDVSGSMQEYYTTEQIKDIIYTIYLTFMEIARISLAEMQKNALIFTAQVDDKMIGDFEKINSITEFINRGWKFSHGGGTDYKDVFDKVLNRWQSIERGKKIPDLTIFVSDFGVDFNFLKEHKYKIFENHLVWLYLTKSSYIETTYNKPPIGEIINVYSNEY